MQGHSEEAVPTTILEMPGQCDMTPPLYRVREEAVPTTILALPNLFKGDFISWHDFTEELADDLVNFSFLCILKYLVFPELFAFAFSHPNAQ